jgi:hypothetical protein
MIFTTKQQKRGGVCFNLIKLGRILNHASTSSANVQPFEAFPELVEGFLALNLLATGECALFNSFSPQKIKYHSSLTLPLH